MALRLLRSSRPAGSAAACAKSLAELACSRTQDDLLDAAVQAVVLSIRAGDGNPRAWP